MGSWRPVLAGSERDAALSVIRDIGVGMAARPVPGPLPGLSGGDAGMAVFYAYAHEADDQAGWADLAQARLDAAADGVAMQPVGASFYAGFPGVAWAGEHIAPRAPAGEDVNRGIDVVLAQQLAASTWPREYDLVGGLVGVGVYALERMQTAGEPDLARACAIRIVDHLEALAEERDGGLTWRTQPRFLLPEVRSRSPDGMYDLGVAHGVPGVLVLLALLRARGIEVQRTHHLLQQGFTWLTRQRNPDSLASRFGYHAARSAEPSNSRLAWCYGDLGVAAALLRAARAGDGRLERDMEEEAMVAAHRACARAVDDCGVADAALCHGSAGLALLHARLYNATGEERFREHARLWYERTIGMRRAGVGIAGYQAWSPAQRQPMTWDLEWVEDAGLLTGAAGIGLCLLAGATEIEPGWDSMLLTSVPPG
jgi:lantibiotic biosynthesis protein